MAEISRGPGRVSGRSPRKKAANDHALKGALEWSEYRPFRCPSGAIQFPAGSGGCAQSLPPANILCPSGASSFSFPDAVCSTENSEEPQMGLQFPQTRRYDFNA
jgi:hypothetical protein